MNLLLIGRAQTLRATCCNGGLACVNKPSAPYQPRLAPSAIESAKPTALVADVGRSVEANRCLM